jgi:membrane protein required for beta-lactamase induction
MTISQIERFWDGSLADTVKRMRREGIERREREEREEEEVRVKRYVHCLSVSFWSLVFGPFTVLILRFILCGDREGRLMNTCRKRGTDVSDSPRGMKNGQSLSRENYRPWS